MRIASRSRGNVRGWLGAALVAFAIVLAAEGGVPLPLPIDIVLIALGERAGAGEIPLWVVMAGTVAIFLLARLMGHRLVERLRSRRPSIGSRIDRVSTTFARRGNLALVVGRTTPGLRTLTVIVAGLSVVRTSVAVILLVVGSSLFVQGHVLLGYAIGPAARSILEDPSAARALAHRAHRRRWPRGLGRQARQERTQRMVGGYVPCLPCSRVAGRRRCRSTGLRPGLRRNDPYALPCPA